MATTPSLQIPHVAQGQFQKEVVNNEAWDILDAAITGVVASPVSPTFGVTVAGTTTWTEVAANHKVGNVVSITRAGVIQSISVSFDVGMTGNARGVLYTIDGDGNPDALLGETDAVANPTLGWNVFGFATPFAVVPGSYVIGIIADAAFILDASAGGTTWFITNDIYSDGASDPWGALSSQSFTLSAYCTLAQVVSGNWVFSNDEMRNAFTEITGVLTENTTITVPSRSKLYAILNSTTGAFTLTIKTSGGSGTEVPQGSVLWLYCDGTDVFPIVNTGGVKL